MSDYIQTERDGAIATITIRRPEKLNALDPKLLTELASELAPVAAVERRSRLVSLFQQVGPQIG